MQVSRLTIAGLFAACAAAGMAAPPTPVLPASIPGSPEEATFETKIRPILAGRCVECHGERNAQGGLRLDTAAGAARAVVPGDPVASPLVRAIRHDSVLKMPPAGRIPDTEVRALTAWVAGGAYWPKAVAAAAKGKHWAFVSPAEPKIPLAKQAGSVVDAFLLARLGKEGIGVAPLADRRTLIRRATFDLTGLPPTPEAVRAFLDDRSPGAWEKVVDRLLASPAYGERWGRHWLDVARYADSNGLDENLAHGNAWRYRDWVVAAMNRDLPYDRFVQQQVAGELAPMQPGEDPAEAVVATGFLTLGAKVLAEQDKPKLVMDIVDEQIDVLSKAVLGVTIACARCHDHKFDPFSTKDYYALAGIFKSTKTMANLDFVSRWNERAVSGLELAARQARHDSEVLAPLRAKVAEAKARRDDPALGGLFVEATANVEGNVGKDQYGKGVINSNGTPTVAAWDIDVPKPGTYRLKVRYAAEESRPLQITVAGKVVSEAACGNTTGSWQIEGQRWFDVGSVDLAAGRVRIAIRRDGAIPHLSRFLLLADGASSPIAAEEAVRVAEEALRKAEAERPQAPVAMAVEEGKPEDVKVHIRGDTQTLGDVAPRGFPGALCGGVFQPIANQAASGRAELALWMTRPNHPLTARVAVNRIWMHLFGAPLVATVDNWGVRGERPSHPELLDWLALRFSGEDRWSQKRMVRRLMLSEAYRRASSFQNAVAERKDPENRLLWKANKRRLGAEPLRDALHFVAGTHDPTIGGNLLPTKNGDYVTNDQSGNAAQYDLPRRAIYLPVIRNAVYDWFQAFDFGDPSMVNARRATTTVAPQALYLVNSPMVRDLARSFARRVLRTAPGTDAGIVEAYRIALQRDPFPVEQGRARRFLERVEPLVGDTRTEALRRDEAWAAFCQALMASNEFIFVD